MKHVLLAALLLAGASPAVAISRYQSPSLTCEQARDVIRREGAVILRYPSERVQNLTRYDRYVRNSGYCDSNEYADWTTVPTRDNPSCRVLACERIPKRSDRRFPLWIVPNNSL